MASIYTRRLFYVVKMEVQVMSQKNSFIQVNGGNEYLVLSRKQGTTRIKIDDILYFEKELRIIHVYTEDDIYSFYGSFKELKKMIDKRFCRCHNSFIVNLNKTVHLERYEIHLVNGAVLSVSQRRYSHTKKSFLRHLC